MSELLDVAPVLHTDRSAQPASLAERLVLGRLSRIRVGQLTLIASGRIHRFGAESADGLRATVTVTDPREFFGALLMRGSIGAGEAYVDGHWTADDLPSVVRVLARNQDALTGIEGGLARLSRPLFAAYHAVRANTKKGSRRNISAHYDVSNEFFQLFLDETMTYSCGFFERPDATLRDASVAKIDRICRKLDLRPTDYLLEIGTGWGALAIHAAREYGCRVTTTTISREQHALARERIHAAGLEDRIDLRMTDYRDLTGRYDKLVSVEMIEAVGHRFFGTFFETCGRLLGDGGRMLIQAITIADQHFEQAKRSVDFIQRYIFPGSCIPSVTSLLDAATRSSDLCLSDLEDITPHYARTLAEWRANLLRNTEGVRELFDERFLRTWEFYFAYCEGGFAERHIGNVHMVLDKPLSQRSLPVPRPH